MKFLTRSSCFLLIWIWPWKRKWKIIILPWHIFITQIIRMLLLLLRLICWLGNKIWLRNIWVSILWGYILLSLILSIHISTHSRLLMKLIILILDLVRRLLNDIGKVSVHYFIIIFEQQKYCLFTYFVS